MERTRPVFLEAADLGEAQHPGIEGEGGHRVGDANRHVMDAAPRRLGHASESCPKSAGRASSVMYKGGRTLQEER